MTEPSDDPSTDGKFATQVDVTGRFEGNIPDNRLAWVTLRIGDVEGELMFQVPSLRNTIDQITADSEAAGDPGRLQRVAKLVADKVLDLYRHPDPGETQLTRTMPDITASRTWSPDTTRGRVQFTDCELDSVRLISPRPRFGSIMVKPGHATRS